MVAKYSRRRNNASEAALLGMYAGRRSVNTTPIMQLAAIGIVTLLALLLVIDWSTRLLVSEPVNTMKLVAIIDRIIGAVIAVTILTVLWASLGGAKRHHW